MQNITSTEKERTPKKIKDEHNVYVVIGYLVLLISCPICRIEEKRIIPRGFCGFLSIILFRLFGSSKRWRHLSHSIRQSLINLPYTWIYSKNLADICTTEWKSKHRTQGSGIFNDDFQRKYVYKIHHFQILHIWSLPRTGIPNMIFGIPYRTFHISETFFTFIKRVMHVFAFSIPSLDGNATLTYRFLSFYSLSVAIAKHPTAKMSWGDLTWLHKIVNCSNTIRDWGDTAKHFIVKAACCNSSFMFLT